MFAPVRLKVMPPEVDVYLPDLVRIRRQLHAMPEIGLQLDQTAKVICEALADLDLEITCGRSITSIAAVLHGARPGPTVLLRADMDALPVVEDTGLDFASTNGNMHACGHDMHMAGLVGAARILSDLRDQICGTVIFAFQPGEEGHGGGRIMIEEGLLEIAERPEATYALHVLPDGPRGVFGTRAGSIMAGMNELHVTVTGTGGHASSPHQLRDPVPVIAEVTLALQTFVTRRIDVADPIVLTVTQLQTNSTAINVVPAEACLAASVRTLSNSSLDVLRSELPPLIEGIAEAHGCSARVELTVTYPVTHNDAVLTERAIGTLRGVLGDDRVEELESPLMASEDFSYFLEEVPGAFILMHAGPEEPGEGILPTLHSARAIFDDSLLGQQALALAALAMMHVGYSG